MLGLLAYIAIEKVYLRLLSQTHSEKKIMTLGILRVLSFILLIVIIGTAQTRYINTKDSYYNYACELYDVHNNLIYQSQYYDSCPEIEFSEVLDDSVHLKLRESTSGFYEYYYYYNPYNENDTYIYDQNITFTLLTDVFIEYNEEGNMINFKKQSSEYLTVGLTETVISTLVELEISYNNGEVNILITDGRSIDELYNSMALRSILEVHDEDVFNYREFSVLTTIPEEYDEYLDVYFENLETNETDHVAHTDVSEYGKGTDDGGEIPGYQLVTSTDYMQGIGQELRTFIHKDYVNVVERTVSGIIISGQDANYREQFFKYTLYDNYGSILDGISYFLNENSTKQYSVESTYLTLDKNLIMYVSDVKGDHLLELSSTSYGTLIKKYERFESHFIWGDTREEYIDSNRSALHPTYYDFNTGTNLYNYFRYLDVKRDILFPSDLVYQWIPYYYKYYEVYE